MSSERLGYAVLLLLILLVVGYGALRAETNDDYAGGSPSPPDWLALDSQCPPPAFAERAKDLQRIAPGRILGTPEAQTGYTPDALSCAKSCTEQGAKCAGWSFSRSRPNIEADGTYACRTFTIDDKDIVIYPPASAGDYFSNSLTCAPRSGPTKITDVVEEAAVSGGAPALVLHKTEAGDCLEACKSLPGCIGATFHGHSSSCNIYKDPRGLVLRAMPGTHHATSASFFAGKYAIPIDPAPLGGSPP